MSEQFFDDDQKPRVRTVKLPPIGDHEVIPLIKVKDTKTGEVIQVNEQQLADSNGQYVKVVESEDVTPPPAGGRATLD